MDQKQYSVFKAFLEGKTQVQIAEQNNISSSRVHQITHKVYRMIVANVHRSGDAERIKCAGNVVTRWKPSGNLQFWHSELENLWTKQNKDNAVKELARQRHIHAYHLGYLHDTLIGYRGVAYALGEDYRIYVHHQSIQMRTEKQAIAHLEVMRKRYGPTLVYGIQEVHVQEPRVVYPAEQ